MEIGSPIPHDLEKNSGYRNALSDDRHGFLKLCLRSREDDPGTEDGNEIQSSVSSLCFIACARTFHWHLLGDPAQREHDWHRHRLT
jgi:hypothetical protein